MAHEQNGDRHLVSAPLSLLSPPSAPPQISLTSLPLSSRKSMHAKSKSCADVEHNRHRNHARRQSTAETMSSLSPLSHQTSSRLADEGHRQPSDNERDRRANQASPRIIRGHVYPYQEGILGLGIEAKTGTGTGTETGSGTGAPGMADEERLLQARTQRRPVQPPQPLARRRSTSNPEAFPSLVRYWEAEHTEGRRPDLGVFIGDEYTTITFRRARENLDAFDIEVWHPDFDNPNFDRFRWGRRSCEDVREEPAAAAALERLSSSPTSEEATYTMRGVPRSSSTSQHDNGVERLRDPKSQPHLNGHRQRLPQQIAANKDHFGSGSDDKDDKDDNSHEQFIDTGDSQILNYRRRTTAFDDNALQFRRQGNIFTDADIESILRAGASSSSSSCSATLTAGTEARHPPSKMRNNDHSSSSSRDRDGPKQSNQHDNHQEQPEKYVYRSRRKSVQYSKRHRSLSRERRELDKTTTMRYEPSSPISSNPDRLRDGVESFPVIVIPERGLSLQENRQKSHEQHALHEEFMKGQINSSLAQDLNDRRDTSSAAGATGQVARRRNTTANVKGHDPWVGQNQPRPLKSILSRTTAMSGVSGSQISGVGDGNLPQSSSLTSPGDHSSPPSKPIKPQWVDEADRGRARRNRVAVARRNTLRRWKSNMANPTASSAEDYQELPSPTSPTSPNDPISPNDMEIRAFNTISSDELDSPQEHDISPTPILPRPLIGRVPSSKPHVTSKKTKRHTRSRSRSRSRDHARSVSGRPRSRSPAIPRRSSSIGRVHAVNDSSFNAVHRENPSTPQSSRSASLIQEAGRERSMSFPLRGRAPAAQQQQRTQPLSSQREDQGGKSEPPLPDDQDHDHPLPDAHHQDTEADTDSHPYREVCLDQEANDEFQRIVQGKDTLISRSKSLRELRDEEVFHTAREELATPEEVKDSSADSRPPPSKPDAEVEGGVSATAIVPRAKKGRQRPNLKLNTQFNQSFIASSVTSGSGDKFVIAPTLESWANRSQFSWVEVCDARAVTIANHPISSVHCVHRARSSRIEEKHEEEDEGDNGDETHEESGRQQPESEPLTSATEAPDYGRRGSRRRSEVHWIDKPPQVKASTPPRRSHTTKERGPRRVYDEESIPSRHSIQMDSQHRLSTGSAAEMAERDVGSPLEYLRRSFRRDSRRASWGGNTDDASSIARHIEQTKRRLEGQPSPPGKPHAHVSDPRAIRAARAARGAQNHEDHKETLWKRMGRKGLQVLKFGRTGSHQEKKDEGKGDETPVRPTARQRTNSGFGSLIRRVSSRRSRRDKAEQARRPAAAPAAVPAATPTTPGARPGRATTGEVGEREERFERQPRSYRQRLQRSLSRASRKLRRRPQEQPRL